MWITEAVGDVRERIAKALPKDSLRGRLIKGAFWSLLGAGIAHGLQLAASVVTARLLGRVGFGELGMIYSTVGMFGVFAGFGLGLTATKHVAQFRTQDPERAGRIIGLSAITATVSGAAASLLILMTAPFLAARTINAPHLATELRIGCGLLFLNALNGAQTGALAGFEAFRTIAKANFTRGLLSFPIMVIGVRFWGLRGAVCAMVIVAAAGWLINHIALRAECRKAAVHVRFSRLRSELPVLWRFSLPSVLASAMTGPVTWACRAMLVNEPNGYAQMGLFSAASQWRLALLFLPAAMGQIVVPVQSSLLGFDNKAPAKKVLRWGMGAAGLVTAPFAFGLLFFSTRIMRFYGEGFADGGVVLSTVAVTTLLLAVQQPVGHVIVASGRMWTGFIMNLGWAIVLLGTSWFLLDKGWGALGLAIGFLVAYVAHGLWTFGYAMHFLRTRAGLQAVRLHQPVEPIGA